MPATCICPTVRANVVRKVDAVTATITAFAGYVAGGSVSCCAPVGDGGAALGAKLSGPEQIFYNNGGLYIADNGNNRVRRVDLATGVISTVAGNGEVAHTGGDADGQSALLASVSPRFIALDPAGNLFLADYKLRRVDTSGTSPRSRITVAAALSDTTMSFPPRPILA